MHAELTAHSGRWVLRDLGSTNGTCVNGQRVTGTVPVREGDQVSFGRMTFRLSAPPLRPMRRSRGRSRLLVPGRGGGRGLSMLP